MRITQFPILLIMPAEEKNAVILREILIRKGYELLSATSMVTALQKISECNPVLIICHHQVKEHSGFRIFNTLQPVLSVKEIPFMLYLEKFSKDDILIGLEMGIDNFIIIPFDEQTLITKVERQIRKSQKGRIFDSDRFKLFFDSTPVAKFIAENEFLININSAFSGLTGIKKDSGTRIKISEIFDFTTNELNELNFRKCMSGLKECCLFKSIPLHQDHSGRFDIHMVYNDYFGKNVFTGEITPAIVFPAKHSSGSPGTRGKINIGCCTPQICLTQREKQVLELSSKGQSIKQIANQLDVSARTVEKHRANIMEKTETSNIIEAIYYLHD